MALLIKSDGTEEIIFPAKKNKWTLDELQNIVDGSIEIMPSVAPIRMVMDEEAKLRSKPVNLKATNIIIDRLVEIGRQLRYLPIIHGDVLILDKGEKL